MNILLTNDDNIFAPGIAAMRQELEKLGNVFMVAPLVEQSGVGQSFSLHTPIVVEDVFIDGNRWGWGVHGTPADCVQIGVTKVCPVKPNLVISGINPGHNCGPNIHHSGTLGAAFEGALFGIPAIAVSLRRPRESQEQPFARAAQIARLLITQILAQFPSMNAERDACGNPSPQVYNINIAGDALGQPLPKVIVAPMDTTFTATVSDEYVDPAKRRCHWILPYSCQSEKSGGTDISELYQNHIVVTPLQLDRTNHARCQAMADWGLSVQTAETPCEDSGTDGIRITPQR